MNTKTKYYLGITLCFIIGAIITPFYGVLITATRLAYCLWGIAYDTFFFIPTMASAFHYQFWMKVEGLKQKNNQLN